jgi:hypothetical protein
MTVVDQGLFGYGLLLLISYKVFVFYKNAHKMNAFDGIFFSVVVFIIYIMQVDSFVYLGTMGYAIFMLLAARVAVMGVPSLSTEMQSRR